MVVCTLDASTAMVLQGNFLPELFVNDDASCLHCMRSVITDHELMYDNSQMVSSVPALSICVGVWGSALICWQDSFLNLLVLAAILAKTISSEQQVM